MQQVFITKSTVFTIRFTDSLQAHEFWNRAEDWCRYNGGTIDMPDRMTVSVEFGETENIMMVKFWTFINENLECTGIENGRKTYRLIEREKVEA
jgi:hypothetical protein